MSARSSWATAPKTCNENIPCGVVVSIGSRRLRKCAPLASSCSITANKWLTERARRSSRTTTRVSPGRHVADEARQDWSAAIGTRGVLLEDTSAAGRAQFVELRIRALVLGGDARIADQTADCGRFLPVLLHLPFQCRCRSGIFTDQGDIRKRSFAEVATRLPRGSTAEGQGRGLFPRVRPQNARFRRFSALKGPPWVHPEGP